MVHNGKNAATFIQVTMTVCRFQMTNIKRSSCRGSQQTWICHLTKHIVPKLPVGEWTVEDGLPLVNSLTHSLVRTISGCSSYYYDYYYDDCILPVNVLVPETYLLVKQPSTQPTTRSEVVKISGIGNVAIGTKSQYHLKR